MNLLIILRINIGNYITVEWVGLLLCSSRKSSIIFIQQHYYDDVDGIGSQEGAVNMNKVVEFPVWFEFLEAGAYPTLTTAEILSGKKARTWVSMDFT